MKRAKIVTLAITLFILAQPLAAEAKKKRKPYSVDRPPQYVLLAFDGSLGIDFWKTSLDFADTVPTMSQEQPGRKVRFTYFINPPYYVEHGRRSVYKTPRLGKPVSCIGWSKPENSVAARMDWTNTAFEKGHEIASHANSHCDASGVDKSNPLAGKPWREEDWSSEFEQFNHMIFNVYSVNGIKPSNNSARFPNGVAFAKRDVVGFRAPLLAYTDGLWPTLAKFGYRYDTSKNNTPTYWPQKNKFGTWNFPLATIKMAGSNKTTYSMDYNWLCRHSGCSSREGIQVGDKNWTAYKNQMLNSYLYYFKINYHGGRAPVHIGHHFSLWNKGAYWEAMKDFTKAVCNRPEVRCVTYSEYADYLDGLSSQQYEKYRKGDFDKLPDDGRIKNIATPILAEVRLDQGNNAFEALVSAEDLGKARTMGMNPQLQINFQPYAAGKITRDDLIQKYGTGNTVTVRAALVNKGGIEVDSQTYRIDKLGTAEETVSEPLELGAMRGESADAHNLPE